MNHRYVILLESKQAIKQSSVGSKAINLWRMRRNGLPVPPAFIISGQAYRDHLSENNIIPRIRSFLSEIGEMPSKDKREKLSGIREAIIEPPLSVRLTEEITRAYEQLGSDKTAVRSSATAEDLSSHSFAGQYETVLGVSSSSSCMRAIKHCWASLWSNRAFDYRAAINFDHHSVDMAIIVQSLIQPDASGVVFTHDPLSGNPDSMVIESCFGFGDILVSGKVTPDQMVISRTTERIISSKIEEKKLVSTLDKKGNHTEITIDGDQALKPSINSKTAKKLAQTARKIESLIGVPLDIEWAIKGKQIYVLQARPITTLMPKTSWEDKQIWTNINLGEIMPDVATPMSWSMIKEFVQGIFGSFFGWIGIELGDHPLVGMVAGRLYFNLNTFVAALRMLPLVGDVDLTRVLGGGQGELGAVNADQIPPDAIPKLTCSMGLPLFNIPKFTTKLIIFLPRNAERVFEAINREMVALQGSDITAMRDIELIQHFHHIFMHVLKATPAIGFTMEGMFFYGVLDTICRKWLGDSEGMLANQMLIGIEDMDSAEAGIALWELSVKANKSMRIAKIVMNEKTWKNAREKLSFNPQGRDFIAAWDEFMLMHGHHTRAELELCNKRWQETPDYILDMIRGYLNASQITNPVVNRTERIKQKNESLKRCRAILKNPVKRIIFNHIHNQAQRGSAIRENIKSRAVRFWTIMRYTLLELGKRFVARGIIEDAEDIFFLKKQELLPLHLEKARFNPTELISKRKKEHKRNLGIKPPKVVVGKFDPQNFVPDSYDENASVLKGLAVCPGKVKGRARVILRETTNEQVLPGEILIAPFTDPGWTPYFLTAAAIVMDQGGILSHGSIVAREYGIPTVVNVGAATKVITTGQIIEVDGTKGIVRILD